MARGLVLIVEDDEWVSRLLAGAIRDTDFETVVFGTAESGVEAARAALPDCIVCDMHLPDHDGYWVARQVRTLPSRVAVAPFLFLSDLDDQASRLAGFQVGADVYMTKPFRIDDVVAQVGGLVQMASRLRARHDSMRSVPPAEAAMAGDLAQMSIATMLTVLELERRTGTFEVVSKKRRARVELASGCLVAGQVGGTGVDPLTALRTMLAWTVGRFSFVAEAAREAPLDRAGTIGQLLIEAVRLQDEGHRDELLTPRGLSLGGPATTAADFAPPSSRAPPRIASTPLARAPLRIPTPPPFERSSLRIPPPPFDRAPLSERLKPRLPVAPRSSPTLDAPPAGPNLVPGLRMGTGGPKKA